MGFDGFSIDDKDGTQKNYPGIASIFKEVADALRSKKDVNEVFEKYDNGQIKSCGIKFSGPQSSLNNIKNKFSNPTDQDSTIYGVTQYKSLSESSNISNLFRDKPSSYDFANIIIDGSKITNMDYTFYNSPTAIDNVEFLNVPKASMNYTFANCVGNIKNIEGFIPQATSVIGMFENFHTDYASSTAVVTQFNSSVNNISNIFNNFTGSSFILALDDLTKIKNAQSAFENSSFSSVTIGDISADLDLDNCSRMFKNTKGIAYLKAKNLNVNDASYMFCNSKVNIEALGISNITNAVSMFEVNKVPSIQEDKSSTLINYDIDISNVKNTSKMFMNFNAFNFAKSDLHLNFYSAEDTSSMFNNCVIYPELMSIDQHVNNIYISETSKIKNIDGMFFNSGMTSEMFKFENNTLDFSGAENASSAFHHFEFEEKYNNIVLTNAKNISGVFSSAQFIYNDTGTVIDDGNLISIYLRKDIENADYAFCNAYFRNNMLIDFGNIESAVNMFSNAKNVNKLTIDTSNIKNCYGMFSNTDYNQEVNIIGATNTDFMLFNSKFNSDIIYDNNYLAFKALEGTYSNIEELNNWALDYVFNGPKSNFVFANYYGFNQSLILPSYVDSDIYISNIKFINNKTIKFNSPEVGTICFSNVVLSNSNVVIPRFRWISDKGIMRGGNNFNYLYIDLTSLSGINKRFSYESLFWGNFTYCKKSGSYYPCCGGNLFSHYVFAKDLTLKVNDGYATPLSSIFSWLGGSSEYRNYVEVEPYYAYISYDNLLSNITNSDLPYIRCDNLTLIGDYYFNGYAHRLHKGNWRVAPWYYDTKNKHMVFSAQELGCNYGNRITVKAIHLEHMDYFLKNYSLKKLQSLKIEANYGNLYGMLEGLCIPYSLTIKGNCAYNVFDKPLSWDASPDWNYCSYLHIENSPEFDLKGSEAKKVLINTYDIYLDTINSVGSLAKSFEDDKSGGWHSYSDIYLKNINDASSIFKDSRRNYINNIYIENVKNLENAFNNAIFDRDSWRDETNVTISSSVYTKLQNIFNGASGMNVLLKDIEINNYDISDYFNCLTLPKIEVQNIKISDDAVIANSALKRLNFNNISADLYLNNITTAVSMFEDCRFFNGTLSFKNIETANSMFENVVGFNLQEGSEFDTSKITYASKMFNNAQIIGQITPFSLNNVIYADEMFNNAKIDFEQISSFDLSNVVHANSIFRSCESFNQPISFSSIKYAQNAFENCKNFNSPVTVPEETIIENASSMFRNCELFNSSIGFKVVNADYMFSGCESFDRFVNLDGTTNGCYMFNGCSNFNQKVDLTSIINGNNMFNGCSSFNQSVTLDGETLIDYNSMFVGVSFDGKTIKANYLNDYSQQPFVGCHFNSCKIQINNSPCLLSFGGMVDNSKIYIDNTQASGHHYSGTQITINNNTNIYVTSIPQDSLKYQTTYSFYSLGGHGTATFNNSLEVKNVYADPQIDIVIKENVGKVSGIRLGGDQSLILSEGITDVSYLLKDSPSFNKSITIPSSVVNASHLINNCQNFDSPVVIPGSVKDTSYMFVNCPKFNQDIVIPEGVTNISYMFDSCSNFNPPNSIVIPNSVTSYDNLINNCVNFQGSFEFKNTEMSLAPVIRKTWYNGSGILTTLNNADCNNEFRDLYGFNQSVTMTENVKNIQSLFYNCYSYNLETTIGTGVKDASRMFERCYNFDSSVIIPDGVENISYMFKDCGSFNQEITIPTSVVNYEGVFENSVFNAPIHCDNKDLLKGIIRNSYYNASGINIDLQIPNDVTSTGRWYENLYGFNQDIEIPAGVSISEGILENCYSFNANITVHENLFYLNTPYTLYGYYGYGHQTINVLTMNNFIESDINYRQLGFGPGPINTFIFDPDENPDGSCKITGLVSSERTYLNCYANNIIIGNNVTNVEYLINYAMWNGSITLGNNVKNLTNMITNAKNFNQSIVFPDNIADGGVWDNMLAYCSNWDSTVTWATNHNPVDITNAVRGTKYSGPLNTTLPSRESLNFYFADYYGLNQEVIIPEETKYIVGIFKNCYNFNQNVIIPDSVLKIVNDYGDNSMFANCWNFNSNVVIGNNVSSASYLFNNLQNFDANVTFGSGLRDLSYMFNNCQKFNQLITVTSEAGWIPNSMLSNCQNFNSQIRIKGLPSGSECQTGDIENVPKILYHCNNFNQSIKYIDGTDLGTNELMSLVHYSGYNGTGLGIPEGIVNAQNWFKDLYRFNQDVIIPDSMVSSDSDFNWNTTDMLHNCFSWNANIFYNNRTPVDFELGFYKTTGYNGSLFAKGWGTITIDGKEFINMTDDYENSDSLDKFYGFNQPLYFNNSPVRLPYNFASELVIDCGPADGYSSCGYNSLSGSPEYSSPHSDILVKRYSWSDSLYNMNCYHNLEKVLPLVEIIDCNSDKGRYSFNFTGITTERLVLENSYVSNLNINVNSSVTLPIKPYDGEGTYGVGVFAPGFNQQITLSGEKLIDNVPCLFLQKSEFNSPIVYSDGTKPEGNVLKTLVANSCYNQPGFNEALDITQYYYNSEQDYEYGNYDCHYQNLYGFNQPVVIPNQTDTFATINMCYTFSNCQNFNQPVVIPDKIYNMYGCFTNCSNFNQDITIFANTTCEETYLESCFENASAKSITILPVGNYTVGDNSYIPLYRMNNAFTNCNCPDIYYCPQKSYYGDDSCIATAFNGGYNGNLHLPKGYPYKEELVRKFFSINNAFEFTANILYDWDIGLPERCINLDSVDYDMLSSSYYSS